MPGFHTGPGGRRFGNSMFLGSIDTEMRDVPSQVGGPSATAGGGRTEAVRIRHFVLLAGAVGANSLASRLGRCVVDLPLAASFRLLDVWTRRVREYLSQVEPGFSDPEVLILAGEADPLPTVVAVEGGPRVRAVRDAQDYRGTAGVLRDLCDGFRDDEHVLVGTASQCPDEGLISQLVAEADPASGVTLSAARDGAPSGLMLIRCGALRQVTSVGYIDLKEQALPRIASTTGVRVVESPVGVSPPIRNIRSYLDAVQSWHRSGSLRGMSSLSPFEERWKPSFSVVEAGAKVAANARLHDSVVLSGGVVESGCEVVRSVVGPGGVARRKDRVLDQLLLGSERARTEGGQRLPGWNR